MTDVTERARELEPCPFCGARMVEIAEEELFGAAKRMARIMGGVFVLNDLGRRKVGERAAALRSGERG